MLFIGRMVLNTYKTMGVKVYAFYYWNMKQKLQYPASAGPKGCWMLSHPRYLKDICKVYLCVPSNIMNRPKHFSMNVLSHFVAAVQVPSRHSLDNMMHIQVQQKMCGQTYRRCTYITWTCLLKHGFQVTLLMITEHTHRPPWASTQDVACLNHDCLTHWGISGVLRNNLKHILFIVASPARHKILQNKQ